MKYSELMEYMQKGETGEREGQVKETTGDEGGEREF